MLGIFLSRCWPVQNQQEQMPVEETANMHLMLSAIAQQKGNTTDFVRGGCVHYLRWWFLHDCFSW